MHLLLFHLITENINKNIENNLIVQKICKCSFKGLFKKAHKKRNLVCDAVVETLFSARWERKFWKTTCPKYEDNRYESQENFFEKNTDLDINKLNDLIGNLHCIIMSLKKMQVNQVKVTVIQMKMRVGKRKTFLPTMPE